MPHPTDPACIFCKIVAGQIPCHRVFENEHVLSFLDIGPLSRGHTLIIPRGHWVTIDQLPDDVAAACGVAAKKISAAISKATGAAGWNVLQNNGKIAGQVVMHVHFHLIPRVEGDGLGYHWPAGKLAADEAAALLTEIRRSL